MIITDDAIKSFKIQLQQSILVCSDRCLVYSVKWAVEILDGIQEEMLDNKTPFTQNEDHLSTISTYHTSYESTLTPLSESEYNKYQYAKLLFQMRQFDSVQDVLGRSKSPKLYFLRLYAKYLAGEKRKEESTQDILGVTEDASTENLELESIYNELDEDFKQGNLDAFGLYLYGIVLKKRTLYSRSAAILLESIRKYQFNWSAWMELASLVQSKKMFQDLQNLLNREFDGSIIKEMFLAKLCIDLYQPNSIYKSIMDPINHYFPKSPYIISQWAVLFNNSKDYNESLVLFEELRQLHPSRLEDLDILSNLLYLQDAKDKLCILALECDKIDKYRPETCCVRANYYSMKRDVSQSVEYFKRALKLNRNYYLAWTLLGHDYIELKDTSAAIECYRRAVNINNRDFRAWYGLGQVYEVMKLPYDAIYYYQKATDLKPDDGRMWRALANCYGALQQDDEMKFCYKRSAACDDKGKNLATIHVAKIFEKMGRMGTAIRYYHSYWEQARKDDISVELAETSLILARYAISKNRYSDAEQYAMTALNTKHPYHEEARNILDEVRSYMDT